MTMVFRTSQTYGEGRHKVEITLARTGDGVTAEIFGGEKPHLGAVALAQPRPSLQDAGKTSSSVIVVPLPSHKDDEIAKPVADMLARHFNEPAAVVAGLHVDNASEKDIATLVQNTYRGVEDLLSKL